tara:strand:+ start:3499 stop:5598 length:2100 start_codon:yes stop_codon:yes gene_type:complete
MSLVILSNRDQNYEFADTEGREINMKGRGTSSPSTFTNHFSNVFTIPRNAEVAVQSVKINRNNTLRITQPKYFSFFMGKVLTADSSYRDSCNLPVVVKVLPGKYGVIELGRQINQALMTRGFDCHPDYRGNCSVVPNFTNGAASDEWKGWKFLMNTSGSQLNTNNADTLLRWYLASAFTEASDWTITNAGAGKGAKILKNGNDPLTYVIGAGAVGATTDMPLSLINGEFAFDPFQFSKQSYWECGLTRPVDADNPAPPWCDFGGIHLTEGSSNPVGFMDYKLTWAPNSAGKYRLFIEQAIVEEGGAIRDKNGTTNTGDFRMVETRYYGISGKSGVNVLLSEDNCQHTLHTSDQTTRYSRFKFVAKGELLELYAFGSNKSNASGSWEVVISGANYKALADPEEGARTYSTNQAVKVPTAFKPINNNCFNLYPKVGLIADTSYITITKWGGRAGSGIFPTDVSPGTSLWARSWDDKDDDSKPNKSSIPYGAIYDIRRSQEIDNGLLMNGIFDTAVYSPVLIKNGEAPEYQLGILPQSHTDSGYDTLDDYVYSSVKGNSAELLGFPNQTAILQTEQGLSFRQNGSTATTPPSACWQVYSAAKPTLSSHTAFIRCPTLTHQSLNMAKELPSKILYHIPRFSNSGKEFGNLFYEPHEKTYLELKNTEELKLNELRVDIVNTDETICEDLAGQTTICLHFRKTRR